MLFDFAVIMTELVYQIVLNGKLQIIASKNQKIKVS